MHCVSPARCALLFVGLAMLVASSLFASPAKAQAPVPVAAASDLQFALPEIAARFEAETGTAVQVTFGSSGNLRRQIAQGAPFQLFFSADESYVQALADEGRVEGEGVVYARGRIVLFVPAGSPLAADGSLADLARALEAGKVTRFAIANPEHAPYGRRAEEALRHAGLWDAITPRLVLGENVTQAAQFASSGDTAGGIVAYSLALSPALSNRGQFVLIPEEWHSPLNQRVGLVAGAGEGARVFYDFIQSPAAREVFERYGFALPGAAD